MRVYFFSRHLISNLMVQHLCEKFQLPVVEIQQFTGTIANIKKTGDGISFDQVLEVDGKQQVEQRLIETNPTVIAVCPLPMQISWLNAGANLLIPQTTKVPVGETGAEFIYTGLIHIKKIAVESEQWAGQPKSVEEVLEQRKLFVAN